MTQGALRQAADVESFTVFVERYQPMLRNALIGLAGPDLAGDAVNEALLYCWQRWDQVRDMENPAGHLWSVGRSKGRDLLRKRRQGERMRPVLPVVPSAGSPLVEPALPGALLRLSERQRVTVFLIHGFGWTHSEVAEFLGVAVPTVQKHAERGLTKLQRALGAQL